MTLAVLRDGRKKKTILNKMEDIVKKKKMKNTNIREQNMILLRGGNEQEQAFESKCKSFYRKRKEQDKSS